MPFTHSLTGGPVLTTETLPCASNTPSDVTFPCDLDTTSIGLTITKHVDHETKMSVMDEMLSYVNKDGIIQAYFDHSRPRIGGPLYAIFAEFHTDLSL